MRSSRPSLPTRAQVKIERLHAPLDIEMLDDQILAVFFQLRRHLLMEFREQRRREPRLGQGCIGELKGIGHPPDAVDLATSRYLRFTVAWSTSLLAPKTSLITLNT